MRRHWRLVKMALRASVWRATAEPPAIGLAGLAMWAVAVVVFVAGLDYATPGTRFSEYGLGLTIGELMLSIVATALVLRAENRVAASAALVVTSFIIVAATVAILKVAGALQEYANVPRWAHIGTVVATIAFAMIWLLGSYAAVVRSFYSDSRLRGWSRAGAAWAVQILVLVTFPSFPVFYTRDSHDNPPNLWSYARQLLPARDADAAVEPKRVDGARVELAQPALMEEAIARLAPQVRGETDVYAIGIAGWAGQDVFIKELAGALAALGNVLPVRDRTLRLVNHADTVERTPVALRANFAAAVRAVGRIMDKEELIVRLFERTRVDLFRRRVLQPEPAAGCEHRGGFSQHQGHDRSVGGARRPDVFQSAGPFRLFADGASRADLRRFAPGRRRRPHRPAESALPLESLPLF